MLNVRFLYFITTFINQNYRRVFGNANRSGLRPNKGHYAIIYFLALLLDKYKLIKAIQNVQFQKTFHL